MPPIILQDLPDQAYDVNLDDIEIGQETTLTWRANTDVIDQFASLSGDKNPLHMDETYAKSKDFKGRVVHGFMLGAKVSGLIGMVIPGRKCLLMEETLAFPAPVYAGDEIIFRIIVKDIHKDLSLLILKVSASKAEKTVMRGRITCKILS